MVLRPAVEADLPALLAILEAPEVAQWWGTADAAELRAQLGEAEDQMLIATVDGEMAGLLLCHEETDPMYRSAGMDIALAPAFQGRGLGQDALWALARFLFEERGHHRLTIDPAAANARAIATYRKLGFRPVGVMRQYERGTDGTWHDGLLMDLLRPEFQP
ncbi:MAG: GNAT family protein [Chloroflexota bacterium]